MMSWLFLMRSMRAGWGAAALACTTQPMTCAVGMFAAVMPPGSTVLSCKPAATPGSPSKNHQGTPFIATSTVVCGPMSARTAGATTGMAGPLTETITRSCTPRRTGSSLARTATVCSAPSPSTHTTPRSFNARSVSPRATAESWICPAGRREPSQPANRPPMAPTPTTATF
jgi:hypothetical protein